MSILDSNGIAIHYEVYGEGRPIVLVHGFASSFQRNWKNTGWVEFLTRHGYQVIGLDMRGHGGSGKLYRPEAYTTPALSGDVMNLLDHLSVAEADLMGYSMGGGIVLRLAMDHPERVRKVVVGGVADALISGPHDPGPLKEIVTALETDDPPSIASPLARQFRSFAEKTDNDRKALAAMMRGAGWPGALDSIRPIDRPVLIVVAGRDEIMAGTERLARAIPHAQIVTIPERNHNTVVGDPRFKEAVLGFLEGNTGF
jgi:pimeloyl-ACP methyl ester carboxylesterase